MAHGLHLNRHTYKEEIHVHAISVIESEICILYYVISYLIDIES